jgi:hypothetical protein
MHDCTGVLYIRSKATGRMQFTDVKQLVSLRTERLLIGGVLWL